MSRNVAIYARVSTEHEAQMSALENQVQYYDNILEQHPDWKLYDRYIDEGITGTSFKKRENFKRMMEDAAAGKFDLIVTREVSRFARNTVDTLQQTRILKKQGVEVYFTEDNIWTMNDEDGELRLTIMATLAQNESKKTSVRVKAGQMISFQNAVPYGNGNILGYDRVGKEYKINEEQAATVRRIFQLYLDGFGTRKIQFMLEKEGYRTSTGLTKWTPGTISRILRNPFYCGILVYRKQYVPDYLEQKKINNFGDVEKIVIEGKHTPIISKEDFETVQRTLDSRSESIHNRGKRGLNISKSVWQKKLRCGNCGSTYQKMKWHRTDNGVQYAYQCYGQVKTGSVTTRKRKGLSTEGICTTKMVQQWKLEVMADLIFQKFWNDRDGVIAIANEMLDRFYTEDNDKASEQAKKIAELNKSLEISEKKYDNLIDMRMAGEIEKSLYDKKREQLLLEQQQLRSQIEELNVSEEEDKESCENKLQILKYGLQKDLDLSTKHIPEEVIDAFVKEIIVCEDGFIWKLNLSPDEPEKYNIEGNKNNYRVFQKELAPECETQHRLQLATRGIRQNDLFFCELTVTKEDLKAFFAEHPEYKKANGFKEIRFQVYI